MIARGAGQESGPPLRSWGNAGGPLMHLAIRNCFSIGGIGYYSLEALDSVCSGVAGAVGSADGNVDIRQNGRYIVYYSALLSHPKRMPFGILLISICSFLDFNYSEFDKHVSRKAGTAVSKQFI